MYRDDSIILSLDARTTECYIKWCIRRHLPLDDRKRKTLKNDNIRMLNK